MNRRFMLLASASFVSLFDIRKTVAQEWPGDTRGAGTRFIPGAAQGHSFRDGWPGFTRIGAITVHWPDGTRERFTGIAGDRLVTLRRGGGKP